jgi:hypothetical protein
MALELKDIETREREIAESMNALKRELEELATVRRVLERMEGVKPVKVHVTPIVVAKRPEGAPTTFEMTETVLEAAEKAGKDGLTAKELVDAIREKYWPGLKSPQVLPIIYGFVPDRLHKTPGGKFKRKKVEK